MGKHALAVSRVREALGVPRGSVTPRVLMCARSAPFHILRIPCAPLPVCLCCRWREATSAYEPTEVEKFLSSELGVGKETVMQIAITKPDLVALSLSDSVRPSVKALKDANIAPEVS